MPTLPKPSAHLIFTGDMMLGRNVETLMKKHTPEYPFEKISSVFLESDYIVSNLEGPINENHVQTLTNNFKFSFPISIATLLKKQNIDFVSLANNHTYDYGKSGYEFTQNTLTQQNIAFAGHPLTINENSFHITTINDQDIIFVSYNQTYNSFDLLQAKKQIFDLSAKYPNHFIILLMHWGNEYTLTSNTTQKNIAHALVDEGVDLVIGHHPHVVQEIEEYNGKLIFYSLGNFIFDQYFSKDVQEGFLIKVIFGKENSSFELLPIFSKLSQPNLMDQKEKEIFLEKLAKRSSLSLQEQIIQSSILLSFRN